MTDYSSASQEYKLWVLLHQTKDAIHKAREKELKKYGLTPIKVAALFAIQEIGHKATPAEVARWLFRKSHSVSGLINRMAKEGLVMKTRDLDRKNLVRLALTEKGQQAYYQSRENRSINRILASLSEEEQQKLGLLLEKLRKKAHTDLGIEYRVLYSPETSPLDTLIGVSYLAI